MAKAPCSSEWAHQVSLPAAWLSLESTDNTPSRFWSYFVSALQTLPAMQKKFSSENLMDLEGAWPSSSPEEALTGLVDEIARFSSPFIMILDDLQLITDPGIHSGLVFILEHLPAAADGMHLVATAERILLPLARMRPVPRLLSYGPGSQVHLDETTSLNQTMGLRLSAGDVAQLTSAPKAGLPASSWLRHRCKPGGYSRIPGRILGQPSLHP
jgi:LuxR family maltose regulon positive regulatory protein